MSKNKLGRVLGSRMFKNGMWLFVLQAFNSILPFLTVPYITRLLSKELYGEFSIALNWIAYFQVVVEYGFRLSGTRKLSAGCTKDEESALYSRVLYGRIFLALLSAAALAVLLPIVNLEPSVKLCIIILFLDVVGTTLQHTWFFQGKEDMKFITISSVISRLISTALIFVLVRSPEDIYLYCFLYSLNFIITGVLGFVLVRVRYGVRIVRCSVKEVFGELRDGWYVFTSSAMTKIVAGIGVTYLAFVPTATTAEIGVYSAIYKIPTLVTLVWAPVSQLLYPYVSRRFSDSWRTGMAYLRKIGLPAVAVYTVGCVFLMFIKSPLVTLLFGSEYAADSSILIPMLVWVIFGMLNNILGIQALVGAGRSKDYSIIFTVSTAVSVGLTLWWGYTHTIYGVAYASMAAEILMSILLLVRIIAISRKEAARTA